MDLTPCETDFNIHVELIKFLQDNPFFAELSRHITKIPTRNIPTAGVAFNEKTDDLCLLYNPDFFSKLSQAEVRGVITHEFYHIVFGHLYGRRRKPHELWNISTDLAINSILVEAFKAGSYRTLTGSQILPGFAYVPGMKYVPRPVEAGKEPTKEERAAQKFGEIIEKLPIMQASEWYFDKINEQIKDDEDFESDGGEGSGTYYIPGNGQMDSHDGWDDIPEEIREYVEGKVKSMVEKAAKTADQQSNGWGNIPLDLIEAIRKSVASVVNWRSVLRQFIGSINRGGRSTSIKRINKRFPYIHPGIKRSYEAKLLIAIDQSGSVSNEMLVEFFGELNSLTKKVSIDVIPFDTRVKEQNLFTWKRGTNIVAQRELGGGTDFNAPTDFANAPKNRGRWDGLLIMSDGECNAPRPSRIKRGYIIGRGRKMMFNTEELQINISDNAVIQGAWR
jgi:predicted metal-dependent peptidase